MSKKTDCGAQEVPHVVDFDSMPSFEIIGKLEMRRLSKQSG
jgi:hypothetical protein